MGRPGCAENDRPLVDRALVGARAAEAHSGRQGHLVVPAVGVVSPPLVTDESWARTPVDRFILAVPSIAV